MITIEQFKLLFPDCIFKNNKLNVMYDELVKSCKAYKITQGNRLNYFLAQCAHESMGFSRVKECLNYSAAQLLDTWPNRFTKEEADFFAHNPQAIANKLYSNRMANGDIDSNDGWNYIGRGFIQLTGKSMYTLYGEKVNISAYNLTSLLTLPVHAINSACWYWNRIGGNGFADKENFNGLTRAINGGLKGLDHRLEWLTKIENILSVTK